MRRNISKGNYYHLYNRGTEKRIIFNDFQDYYRFIFQMFACNIGSPATNIFKKEIISITKLILNGGEIKNKEKFIINEHPPLVDILVFCLMPNHFHFILHERIKWGISKFMQKLGTAYTMYFNLRNERSGNLFQGKFKSILIEGEDYLLALLRYIHLNPGELVQTNWKEGIKSWKKINNFLETYQWSSYLDYLGLRDSKLIQKGIFNTFFNNFNKKGLKEYEEFIKEALKEKEVFKKELKSIQPIILEYRKV